MIIDMPNTRTREIAHKIEQLHEERGESATGRVLTLLIATEDADLEHALEIANSASREHPCRVIAVVPDTNPADQSGEGEPNAAEVAAEVSASRDNPAVDLTDGPNDPNDSNLNAQVRFGADAGAGEIIILRPRGGLINHPDTLVIPLLVPDAPVVAWWPTTPPSNPAKDLMGAMARSRITDALHSNNPEATIERLRRNWTPEDIDLSWTRLTVWRAMLASMLDQPPHLPITAVKVTGKKMGELKIVMSGAGAAGLAEHAFDFGHGLDQAVGLLQQLRRFLRRQSRQSRRHIEQVALIQRRKKFSTQARHWP